MKELNDFIKYLKINRNYSLYTIKNYELDIKDFINYCNNEKNKINTIKYDEVKKYLLLLHNKKYKSSTISRKLSSIRSFYDYLYDKEIVDKNIFKNLPSPKKEKKLPKFVTSDDIELLFNIPDINSPLGQRNRLILEILYATGIRVGELCNIKISDIDFNNKSIRILGKGSKERIVLYGSNCEKILKNYLEDGRNILLNGKNNEYLIIGLNRNGPLSTRSVELVIDEIITKASLSKNVTPHVFRHTFATHLLNEGCDILIVKELLGHSSLDTTGIYTHVSNERLRNVYLNSHPRARNK